MDLITSIFTTKLIISTIFAHQEKLTEYTNKWMKIEKQMRNIINCGFQSAYNLRIINVHNELDEGTV